MKCGPIFFGFFGLLIEGHTVFAATTDYAFKQVPSRFQTLELTASSRGLGEVCLGRDVFPDGTVCNPAFLPDLEESTILARVYFGNGYTAISTANSLLNDQMNRGFLEDLFAKNSVSSVEAHAGLYFGTKYFSAAFSPYRVQYLSEIHNPNFPVLSIHAANERSLVFSGGVPLRWAAEDLDGFTFGTRLRLLERTYVHGAFSSFDLLAHPASELIPVKHQKAIFFDPSIAWTPKENPLKIKTSLGAKNLGTVSSQDPLYPEKVDLGLGFGLEPPTGVGRWRLTVDAVDLIHAEETMDRFRLGTSFQYGMIEPMVGLNSNAFTSGIHFGLGVFQAGIVYEFVRKELDGNAPENRVSTELSIKL